MVSLYNIVTLLLLTTLSLSERVSLRGEISDRLHYCVRECLAPTFATTDLGDVLSCAWPYQNECFCPTASSRISKAYSWLNKCATAGCAAGDLDQDSPKITSLYASYCSSAGFDQGKAVPATTTPSGNAAPITTSKAGDTPPKTSSGVIYVTVTQTLVVTETKVVSSAGRQVTVGHGTILIAGMAILGVSNFL